MTTPLPSAGRIALALVAASAAAPLPFALFLVTQAPDQFWVLPAILIFGFPAALLHALLLALPTYLLVRRRWPLAWWSSGAIGFLIGIAPSALFLPRSPATFVVGACGIAGGVAFWLVLREKREEPDDLRRTFA